MKPIYIEKDTHQYVIKIIGNGYVGKGKKKHTDIRNARRFTSRQVAEKVCEVGQLVLTLKSQLEE